MTQRTNRVDELLRQEISALIVREIADPRIGFATITDVETAPDLRHARVWVSVIGSPEERKAAVQALQRAMPFIRHELGGRLRIRRIPELHVEIDDTMERGTRVLRLLNELEAGTDPAELAVPEDALPTPVARLPHEGDAPEPPADARPATGAGAGPGPGPSAARTGRRAREARRRDGEGPRRGTGGRGGPKGRGDTRGGRR
ncbi:MAG TPA: 30S ribosome-binding factor RbfA [Candidatus Limnocylindrales bacterium]|nr:30S ribosome-binding factor RbfA [Candidatus Limnocylindrales bacterium]